MEREHFDDLKKIDVQLGLLDDDTYNRLRAHDGPIEFDPRGSFQWREIGSPSWFPKYTYRAKPQPLTKPDVPWEHMADWVQYVARDGNGKIWAYDGQPFPCIVSWSVVPGCVHAEHLDAFKIDPGTCYWRDSLVKRPEGL